VNPNWLKYYSHVLIMSKLIHPFAELFSTTGLNSFALNEILTLIITSKKKTNYDLHCEISIRLKSSVYDCHLAQKFTRRYKALSSTDVQIGQQMVYLSAPK
jgi:hypothetical protein